MTQMLPLKGKHQLGKWECQQTCLPAHTVAGVVDEEGVDGTVCAEGAENQAVGGPQGHWRLEGSRGWRQGPCVLDERLRMYPGGQELVSYSSRIKSNPLPVFVMFYCNVATPVPSVLSVADFMLQRQSGAVVPETILPAKSEAFAT